jgi:predicted small secreted protein
MKTNTTRIALLLLIATLSTSCNTVRGVGRDVRHAGSHIEHAVDH